MGTTGTPAPLDRVTLPTELVVPLDGSAGSTRALPVAAVLGEALGASVSVVDCLPAYLSADAEVVWVDAQVDASGVAVARQEIHPTQDVVGDLLETLRSRPEATLCAATHGHAGLSEIVLGSVTRELLLAARVPVVLVGPQARVPERVARIQLCYDGSAEGAPVLDAGAAWATALGATPWITHVVEADPPDEAAAPGDVAVDTVVFRGAARLREDGLEPEWDVLHGSHPAEALTSWARAHDVDLLVVRAHHRSLLERARGTVTARILHDAPCPVLVIGPAAG